MNSKIKSIIEILIIIGLFVFFSYFIQININFFKGLISNYFLGIFIYILIIIIAIVIAPINTIALLPIASNLWGWKMAGLFSIIGWTVGAMIAFVLARTYGVSLIKRFVPLRKINRFEKKIPNENLFWSIVFLRMVIPVDILSYALGLFSKIKTRDYFLATLIGVSPFAFILAYLGTIPFKYQIIILITAGIIFFIGIILSKKKIKSLWRI